MTAGLIMWAVGVGWGIYGRGAPAFVMSNLFGFSAAYLLIVALAFKKDGLCRGFLSRWKDFEDPPLDEWKNDLEERDLFMGGEA